MIVLFRNKKFIFYIFTITQTIIFSYPVKAISALSLPNDNFSSSLLSTSEPIKAPPSSLEITNYPKQILARVNNEPITVEDVEALVSNLPQELKSLPKELLYPQLIKQLIVDRALMVAIQKDGIDKQLSVQQDIQVATKNLVQQKLSQAYFFEKLKPFLTEQAIQHYYNAHYLHQPHVKEVHLRQIIVQTPEIAQIILQKLKDGHTFTDLASIYSIDLQNGKIKQGDIGWFKEDTLTPSIAQTISVLHNDEYTKTPIKTDYGWVLFQKINEHYSSTPPLNSVRQSIKEQITKEAIMKLYEESLKKVHIIEY